MGLTTGHVFSDGDTVTAAKLNAMVNDATIDNATITASMLKDDVVEARHISDGAISSNHLTAGAVSIGAVESGQTTEGYLVQTDSSGDLTTLNVGASGTVLVSGGAETAPSFTTVGAAGINAAMISDHDKLEAPDVSDLVFAKSISAGVNKRVEMQDIYRTVSGLTSLASSDIASGDELLVIDGGTPKKITKANFESSMSVSPSEFYYINTSDHHGSGIPVKDGSTTAPIIIRGQSSDTVQRPAATIDTSNIVPAQQGEKTTGVRMPYGGEIVKIVTMLQNGGGTGGTFTVVNVDPAGTFTNNTALVSATIPTTDGWNTTNFTTGNSFSAGDYLSYWAKCGHSSNSNFHAIIVFKFTL